MERNLKYLNSQMSNSAVASQLAGTASCTAGPVQLAGPIQLAGWLAGPASQLGYIAI